MKHGKYVVMWGCFGYNGVGQLHRINGIMNARKYRLILSTQMIPSSRELFDGSPWIFQHDNDPKHTSGLIQRYLANKNVNVMVWPSQSPDLNPIENLWSKLDFDVRTRKCNTKDDLFNVLRDGWENLAPDYLQKLVESMPNRCREVVKAHGHGTKY